MHNGSSIREVLLTPSNSESSGAKVIIYEQSAVVSSVTNDSWCINADPNSRWILGLSLNSTQWGFRSGIYSKLTIQIQGEYNTSHALADNPKPDILMSLSMNNEFWNIGYHPGKLSKNRGRHVYPSCGNTTTRSNFATGNVYNLLQNAMIDVNSSETELDRWSLISRRRNNWDEIFSGYPSFNHTMTFDYNLNGNLDISTWSTVAQNAQRTCFYQNILTDYDLQLYFTIGERWNQTLYGNLRITGFKLVKEQANIPIPITTIPASPNTTTTSLSSTSTDSTATPTENQTIIPTIFPTMSPTIEPSSKSPSQIPTKSPTISSTFEMLLYNTSTVVSVPPYIDQPVQSQPDLNMDNLSNQDNTEGNDSLFAVIIIVGIGTLLLLALIICALKLSKSKIREKDHPSRLDLEDKFKNNQINSNSTMEGVSIKINGQDPADIEIPSVHMYDKMHQHEHVYSTSDNLANSPMQHRLSNPIPPDALQLLMMNNSNNYRRNMSNSITVPPSPNRMSPHHHAHHSSANLSLQQEIRLSIVDSVQEMMVPNPPNAMQLLMINNMYASSSFDISQQQRQQVHAHHRGYRRHAKSDASIAMGSFNTPGSLIDNKVLDFDVDNLDNLEDMHYEDNEGTEEEDEDDAIVDISIVDGDMVTKVKEDDDIKEDENEEIAIAAMENDDDDVVDEMMANKNLRIWKNHSEGAKSNAEIGKMNTNAIRKDSDQENVYLE